LPVNCAPSCEPPGNGISRVQLSPTGIGPLKSRGMSDHLRHVAGDAVRLIHADRTVWCDSESNALAAHLYTRARRCPRAFVGRRHHHGVGDGEHSRVLNSPRRWRARPLHRGDYYTVARRLLVRLTPVISVC
jgi:hypothetical protein